MRFPSLSRSPARSSPAGCTQNTYFIGGAGATIGGISGYESKCFLAGRAFLLTLDKDQKAGSWGVTVKQTEKHVRVKNTKVSLHTFTRHRFDAYKRLKSSLWLSSPFPSDTMLSSLSISSASTYTNTHSAKRCGYAMRLNAAHRHLSDNHKLKWWCRSDLFEVAIFPLLPIHHVMENWDHNISNLRLRHQGDAKEGTHHSWDEVGLVVTWLHKKTGANW